MLCRCLHVCLPYSDLSNSLQQLVKRPLIPVFARKFFRQLSSSISFEEMKMLNQNPSSPTSLSRVPRVISVTA